MKKGKKREGEENVIVSATAFSFPIITKQNRLRLGKTKNAPKYAESKTITKPLKIGMWLNGRVLAWNAKNPRLDAHQTKATKTL